MTTGKEGGGEGRENGEIEGEERRWGRSRGNRSGRERERGREREKWTGGGGRGKEEEEEMIQTGEKKKWVLVLFKDKCLKHLIT